MPIRVRPINRYGRSGRTPRTRPTRIAGTHRCHVAPLTAPTSISFSPRSPMLPMPLAGSTRGQPPATRRSASACSPAWRSPRPPAGWPTHSPGCTRSTSPSAPAGLTAPAALAALGAGARALPQTIAQPAGRRGWEDPPLDALPAADQAIADALGFARVLCRLPGGGPHPFASAAATADSLAGLGATIDRDTLGVWWSAHAPAPPVRRRYGARRGEGSVPRPPLLAGALAAQAWMQAAITDPPEPAFALLASFGRLARLAPVRHVFVPFWSAYPAVGFSDRAALPTLRSEAADRIAGWGVSIAWPAAGLHLVAESARMGLRDLDRLAGRCGQGEGRPRRCRPPFAFASGPRGAAARAAGDPEGARHETPDRAADRDRADARDAGQGVAREVTGRGRFRAFAV